MSKIFFASSLIVFLVACAPQTSAPITTSPTKLSITLAASLTPLSTKTYTPEIAVILSPTAKPPDIVLDSPNGEFRAEFDNAYSHPAFKKQVIEIFDKNGSLLWEIPYQHETAMVDPHPSMSIYGWSKDSNYLYFYYRFSPDGGDRAFWWDGFDFQRINVHNGNIEQVIKGDGFVAFAFSPDETKIAYTREQDSPSIIFVHNLSTGVEQTAYVILASKNYVRVGDIHWSPSGTEIVFQTETNEYIVQTIYLNLSTMKQKVIREYKLFSMWLQGWSNDGKLEFFEKGNIVHVIPQNSETIVVGTPTPTP